MKGRLESEMSLAIIPSHIVRKQPYISHLNRDFSRLYEIIKDYTNNEERESTPFVSL